MTVVWQSSEYLIGNFSVDCRMLLLYFFSWIFFSFFQMGVSISQLLSIHCSFSFPTWKRPKRYFYVLIFCFEIDFLFWNRYKTRNIIWQTSFLLCSSVFTSKGYRLWHLLCKKIKYWIYKWQQIVNRLKKARDEFNKYLFGNFFVIFCTSMLQSVY